MNRDANSIANKAHDFAISYLNLYGQPDDALLLVKYAADQYPGDPLSDDERQLFIERAVGHFVNAACGTRGV
jgi:hypothetical protein